jgi:hypothetical protein
MRSAINVDKDLSVVQISSTTSNYGILPLSR